MQSIRIKKQMSVFIVASLLTSFSTSSAQSKYKTVLKVSGVAIGAVALIGAAAKLLQMYRNYSLSHIKKTLELVRHASRTDEQQKREAHQIVFNELQKVLSFPKNHLHRIADDYLEGRVDVKYGITGKLQIVTIVAKVEEQKPKPTVDQANSYGTVSFKALKNVYGDGKNGNAIVQRMTHVLNIKTPDTTWVKYVVSPTDDEHMCAICLRTRSEIIEEKRKLAILPCGHVYCLEGVNQLSPRTCPYDRRRFANVITFDLID